LYYICPIKLTQTKKAARLLGQKKLGKMKTLDLITKNKIQKRVSELVKENGNEDGFISFDFISEKIVLEFGEIAIEEAKGAGVPVDPNLTPKDFDKYGHPKSFYGPGGDPADQKSWEKIVKATDPGAASSRSSFGIAASGNAKADRALDSLQNNKIFTNQDLQNALADVDSIYQGGAPSDSAMKRGDYESIRQRLAQMRQFVTGRPTDAVPPQIRQHIIENLRMMLNTTQSGQKPQNIMI